MGRKGRGRGENRVFSECFKEGTTGDGYIPKMIYIDKNKIYIGRYR